MGSWSSDGLLRRLCVTLTTIIFLLSGGLARSEELTTITGNHPAEASSFNLHARSNTILHIKIKFAPRDRDALIKLLSELQDRASPLYHHWLSPQEYENRFGQPRARRQEVQRWLSGNGFRVTDVSAGEISATGTVAQAEKAFSIAIVVSSDRSRYANQNDPTIPARFAGIIESIQGLDNLGRAIPLAVRGPEILTGYYFKPSDLHTFYNETPLLNAGIDGASLAYPKPGPGPPRPECGIALVEVSDYLDAAVDMFTTTYSLPGAGIQRVFPGANPGRNNSEGETLLDIEWSHAVAPGAFIRVYISDLSSAISRAISDGACGAISISFIFCGYSNSFYQSLDSSFMRAAAQGQSVFVSSGRQCF